MLGELYGASPELVEVMVDLARNLGQKGNWTSYRDVYSESLRLRSRSTPRPRPPMEYSRSACASGSG